MTTENEARQIDQGAFATKLDLANLRAELKGEIAEVRIAVAGIQGQMKLVFAFLTAILVAVLSIILKGAL